MNLESLSSERTMKTSNGKLKNRTVILNKKPLLGNAALYIKLFLES